MASNENSCIPAPVRATLDHVLCQSMDPKVAFVNIRQVYVYGQEHYDSLDKAEGWALSHTNWFIDGKLYVLNRAIPAHEEYGPYSLIDIFNLPRVPAMAIYRIMDTIDSIYTHLAELDRRVYWKLHDEDIYPKPIFELPHSVVESAKFAYKNYQPELETCLGLLVLPVTVLHNGWEHKRVRVVKRDKFTITMLEVEDDAWFLLQSCRTRFFEESKDPAWFLMHKNHLSKFC